MELNDAERTPCEVYTPVEEEEWKIHNQTGYEVSSMGRVRKPGGAPRKLKTIGVGYVGVNIVLSGEHTTQYVHIMVLEAFVGNRPGSDYQVSHLNGIRTDNRLSNLAWETVAVNSARRREHGTSGEGASNAMAKLKLIQALFIKTSNKAPKVLASLFNVSAITVLDIKAGRTWGSLDGNL